MKVSKQKIEERMKALYFPSHKTYRMKKKLYFAKYLPVEGEIKEGDIALKDGKIHTVQKGQVIMLNHPDVKQDFKKKVQKVKLFLCSRDNPDVLIGEVSEGAVPETKSIQLPATYVATLKSGQEEQSIQEKDLFKVIGEISNPNIEEAELTDEQAQQLIGELNT